MLTVYTLVRTLSACDRERRSACKKLESSRRLDVMVLFFKRSISSATRKHSSARSASEHVC